MKDYNSKIFYHRDDLTGWLNNHQSVTIVNIIWQYDRYVLFYFI